ncbi:MAG TPA: RpiB/LacA/LacB family sugar-phosphate isomerase [Candidatus Saccharimonadales bacterium]|nr:RpiB/LacA/LacB family sugar-phosphate isomerase [Candidatus Saccharimonadales bacterium]
MKVYVGTDHHGYHLKEKLLAHLAKHGYQVVDEGDKKLDPNDDFPVFASRVVNQILASDDADPRGILLCGSGQGMCMAANRYQGIRASLGWSKDAIRASRNDDNANVLCLPVDELGEEKTMSLVDTFLTTEFSGAPRYIRRLNEIDNLT